MTPHEPETIEVRIGRATLKTPIYGDPETTQSLAEEVTRHIAGLEEASARIDSHAFALQTALHYAAQAHDIEAAAKTDTGALVKTLERLNTALETILDRLAGTA